MIIKVKIIAPSIAGTINANPDFDKGIKLYILLTASIFTPKKFNASIRPIAPAPIAPPM